MVMILSHLICLQESNDLIKSTTHAHDTLKYNVLQVALADPYVNDLHTVFYYVFTLTRLKQSVLVELPVKWRR